MIIDSGIILFVPQDDFFLEIDKINLKESIYVKKKTLLSQFRPTDYLHWQNYKLNSLQVKFHYFIVKSYN